LCRVCLVWRGIFPQARVDNWNRQLKAEKLRIERDQDNRRLRMVALPGWKRLDTDPPEDRMEDSPTLIGMPQHYHNTAATGGANLYGSALATLPAGSQARGGRGGGSGALGPAVGGASAPGPNAAAAAQQQAAMMQQMMAMFAAASGGGAAGAANAAAAANNPQMLQQFMMQMMQMMQMQQQQQQQQQQAAAAAAAVQQAAAQQAAAQQAAAAKAAQQQAKAQALAAAQQAALQSSLNGAGPSAPALDSFDTLEPRMECFNFVADPATGAIVEPDAEMDPEAEMRGPVDTAALQPVVRGAPSPQLPVSPMARVGGRSIAFLLLFAHMDHWLSGSTLRALAVAQFPASWAVFQHSALAIQPLLAAAPSSIGQPRLIDRVFEAHLLSALRTRAQRDEFNARLMREEGLRVDAVRGASPGSSMYRMVRVPGFQRQPGAGPSLAERLYSAVRPAPPSFLSASAGPIAPPPQQTQPSPPPQQQHQHQQRHPSPPQFQPQQLQPQQLQQLQQQHHQQAPLSHYQPQPPPQQTMAHSPYLSHQAQMQLQAQQQQQHHQLQQRAYAASAAASSPLTNPFEDDALPPLRQSMPGASMYLSADPYGDSSMHH
jgi:hypothetical protein